EVWLDARQEGVLGPTQEQIAAKADILLRGLAHVGIIALVDEATGFQAVRARDALAKILEAFVTEALQKWVRTFPPAFYEELFRLRGLEYPPKGMKMPQYFGHLTNNIVYDRIAPGVKAELKRVTPRDETGRHKDKLFQRLTEDVGHPRLREHLASVIALMRVSPDYETFDAHLNKALPKWDETLPIPFAEAL
ncbi:MAG: P63C domain-containing protein, partial [Gemmatimonadota bacterium]